MRTAATGLGALVLTAVTLMPATALATAAAPAGARAAAPSIAAPAGLTASEVSFTGFGGITLHGTVLAPAPPAASASGSAPAAEPATRPEPRPGIVLVTGSGSGVPREHLLTEATEFARQGLAVLIYDKRSVGYTLFRRSYSELADDAVAAAAALRAHPGVDPARVGLWGLSEGGWVVPLAASRSPEVAFVVVVGANAMQPIRQQLWNETTALREAGVSGSLVDHGKRQFMRLGADAGLFAEAYFDAPGVLGRVRQPLLAVWGGGDRQTPPQDNPPLMSRALRDGGNARFTFRFFPGATHGVHASPDGGLTRGEALAPGYAALVGAWVRSSTGPHSSSGSLPEVGTTVPPVQAHPSVEVPPSAWWESSTMHLAAFVLLLVAFTAYPLTAAVRRLRRLRPAAGTMTVTVTTRRWARVLAGAGGVAVPGLLGYLFYLMAAGRAPDPGPVLGGRPLPWLVLQALALTVVVAGLGTAWAWRRGGGPVPRGERLRLGLLLLGGAVFAPWAAYWGLLLP